jgi:hypothetical protein
MEIAILGLPQSGKSTLFEIMTGVASRERFGEPTVRALARVPDPRFDELVRIFSPRKVSPAAVPFMDLNAAGEDPWAMLRKLAGSADGIVHVVDGFTKTSEDEMIAHYQKLSDEISLSDLAIIEHKIEKLAKIQKAHLKPEEVLHSSLLPELKEALEKGHALRTLTLTDEEHKSLRGFAFWTLKPELIVLNTHEEAESIAKSFAARIKCASPVIDISCQIEMEISKLPAAERSGFLEGMGITEPAFERIIRTAFKLLGRIWYYTVGEDEVKAWVIPAGSTAPRAACAIHKDFERGFIKAEVVSYDDFIASGRSIAAAKAAGKQRLEGKEYIVEDGDIISFRFNV